MRRSKCLTAAGLALCAAPAMACDLEAFGERRFSAFGGLHGGGVPQAPAPSPPADQSAPADQSTTSDQTSPQQDSQSDASSGQDQASSSSDSAPSNGSAQTDPTTAESDQEDAATFR